MDAPEPGHGESRLGGAAALFFALYFVQGFGDPDDGLLAQPVRSLLKEWSEDPGRIAAFSAALTLPWTIKPLYGLLCDFVPFFGQHRRSYLIAATASSALGLLALYVWPPVVGETGRLLWLLALPAIGVAFSDVVADALMIESGRALGLQGRLQAVQWAALYIATIATGSLGGLLSTRHQQPLAFLVCAGLLALTTVLALYAVREAPSSRRRPSMGAAWKALRAAGGDPTLRVLAALLLLWNFNPFTSTLLYLHLTQGLHVSEQTYGHSVSVGAVAAVLAACAYGGYCRRIAPLQLMHGTILLGVLSTLLYLALSGERSALAIAAIFGACNMTASLMQLDLAAQLCPNDLAGTLFATLMAICNLAGALGTWLGGELYAVAIPHLGRTLAYDLLVGLGAATTAACWLLLPALRRSNALGFVAPHRNAALAEVPAPLL